MKKYLLFAFFLLPLIADAQKKPYKLSSNEVSINRKSKDLRYVGKETYRHQTTSVDISLKSRGDTILPGGTHARWYLLPHLGQYFYPYASANYTYWWLPDSVRVIIKKDTYILYPGILPGLHNFASDEIVVDSVSGRDVFFKYIDRPPSQSNVYNKPSRIQSCEFGGYSMYAKVKILGENENIECNHAVFKVRAIVTGSKEKADFDVRIVTDNRWGLQCAQWRWVDKDEDFCVRFVNSGEAFTVRIIEK